MALPKLGELMMLCGLITRDQLNAALAEQAEKYRPLGRILVDHGAISEEDLNGMLEFQLASFSI